MTKQEAKRMACRMAHRVITGARAAGWPWNEDSYLGVALEDANGNETADARRLEASLDELADEFRRRGDQ